MTELTPEQFRKTAKAIDELKFRAIHERLWNWKAQEQQQLAYVSTADEVWLFGGNRSGKTELVCVVAAEFAQGVHPVRSKDRKPPVYIRHCATDWGHGVGVILKKYQQLIPRVWLKNNNWNDAWSERGKSISFKNGSRIVFRVWEQELNKFGADDLDMIAGDEHGAMSYYIENKMRLADRNGFMMSAMTPEEGMTWEAEHVENPPEGLSVDHFYFDLNKNPYVSEEGKQKVIASIKDPVLADAKIRGLFVVLTGRVIPSYNPSLSIIPDRELHPDAVRVFCIDLHAKAPSAALWGAWEPSGGRDGFDFIVYRTMKRPFTVDEWKRAIVATEGEEKIMLRLGDESERVTGQKGIWGQDSIVEAFNQVNDDCSIVLDMNRVERPPGSFEAGIFKLRNWFKPDKTGRPRIFMFESCNYGVDYINGKPCGSLPWELDRYSFKKEHKADEEALREKVATVNDHYIDGVRYLVMQGPVAVPEKKSTGPLIVRREQFDIKKSRKRILI